TNSTPVFWIEDKEDDEYEATTWGDLSGFDTISKIDTIYFDKDGDITYLVIDKDDTDIEADVEETAAVINAVRLSGNDIVRVDAWINGKLVKNIKVDEIDISKIDGGQLSKGDLVTLLIDEKTGEVVAKDDDKIGIAKRSTPAEFKDLTGRTLTVDTKDKTDAKYRLTSDLVVYDHTGSDVKVKTISDIRNLDDNAYIELYTAVE